MYPYLPSSVDRLSSEGIVNFDAEAFVKGQKPRFVAAPEMNLPFEQPLNTYNPYTPIGTEPRHLAGQPQRDEFSPEGKKPRNWKKTLMNTLILGGLAIIGIRNRKAIGKLFKKSSKKVSGWFKSGKTNKSKKAKNKKVKTNTTPAPAPTPTPTHAETKKPSWVSRTWSKTPKWVKIAGGSVIGLLGLRALFNRRRPPAQQG